MTPDDPLEPLGGASEEEDFHQKNKALIDEMRERLKRERLGKGLAASGIDDDVVFQALLAMGVEADVLPVLHLAPLLQVAWAVCCLAYPRMMSRHLQQQLLSLNLLFPFQADQVL